ncbi:MULTISPECIES: DUF29 domain-containing protein [Oscillatoriales]|uniref:DUF29 domain-containing protein n=1 Tax=Oscillatoriales TaxID=1150 RepID=UPI0028E1250D|nr:DUF29 domain-containing protein [Limnospira sp. PMC 289.06]
MQQLSESLKSLYDTDYHLWVLETVKHLKKGDFEAVDLENLIEEVLDLSKRDKRKLASLLTLLFEHLLKLKYWHSEKENNQNHWRREIRNFRKQIKRHLKDSPSLQNYLSQELVDIYEDARELVSDISGLSVSDFPSTPIANLEEVLDENWFP